MIEGVARDASSWWSSAMPVPDLARWDRLSESECLDFARDLVLPDFAFDRLVRCAQGDAARWVAVFRHRSGAEFALVPGGTTTLGYDTARPLALDTEAMSSWDTSMSEFGMPSLPTYLSEVLQPARQVTIAPSLIEIAARSIGDAIGEPDDDDDSSAHERVVAALEADGLRLLTADEWEHACSGGTRTLWRWGDACPSDCEPYGQVPFVELRRPNAFGLVIAQNPYDWEYIDDPDEMRGGDGGEALCGGYGAVASWIALASSYRWPMFDEDSYLEEGFVRRAITVG